MDFENIVKWQIVKACKNLEIKDIKSIKLFVDFFRWYYEEYQERFGRDHTKLTTPTIERVIENLWSFDEIKDGDLEDLEILAERYFLCGFSGGTDYSIVHFSCPEILQNRIYEEFL